MRHQPTLRLVSLFEAAKGGLGLVIGGAALVLPPADIPAFANRIVSALRLDPAARTTALFLREADRVTEGTLRAVAAGAAAYALFRFIEAYGLWRQRTWAEWLAVACGAIYVPFEFEALVTHPTWARAALLLINLLVVLLVAMALAQSRRPPPTASK